MSEKLTPQQAQAVHNRGGKLLVSAAAGSGKTKVLVDRLMDYLLDPEDPADLDEFLIITYTKAAATELRGKIAAKLTQRIAESPENRHLQKQLQKLYLTKISTVHGLCSDLLREYAYRLDLPADFRVGDENECQQLRDAVLTDLLEESYAHPDQHPDFLPFVEGQGLGRDDGMIPFVIQRVYDSAHCHRDPMGWLQACQQAAQVSDITDAAQTLWGQYLMEDLKNTLAAHIAVLQQCRTELECAENMEKPAIHFGGLVAQLQELAQAETWDEVVNRRNIDYGRLTFPRKNVDGDLIARVKAAREACKKGLEQKLKSFADDSAQVLQDLAQAESGVRGLIALVEAFAKGYRAAKRSRRILDFSDLEQKTLDLLLGSSRSGPTTAAREIGSRYREVMVDEYQDSNAVQDAIFDALTRDRQNCFLVGDVKQSIYQFRLADPGIFLQKYHAYGPVELAQPGQGRKVLLSHNFRSGPEIVEAVNQVFATCMRPEVGGLTYGEAEALREGVSRTPLAQTAVELYAMDTDTDSYAREAAFVAQRIREMLDSRTLVRSQEGMRPVEPEDIVILLRSPGSAGAVFQNALEAKGIRCASATGTDLLKTQEVTAFRCLLQSIANPRLDIPLVAALMSPIFGFTAEDLAAIREAQKKGSIYDALLESGHPKAMEFCSILEALRQEARRESLTVLLERCFTLTRLDSIYAAMEEGQLRRGNLQAFYQLAVDFEALGSKDLNQFLEHLTALERRGIPAMGSGSAGCVTIMSIHKSKGLEFPVVFLCNLSRAFNQEGLRAQLLCDQELGLGLSAADNQSRVRYPTIAKRAIAVKMQAESLSEEMRVLYVAMTRARDRMIMTCAPRGLEKKVQELANRYDFDGGELLCRDAGCLGDWVLLAALRRVEAGQLHALGARPRQLQISEHPWQIQVVVSGEEETAAPLSREQANVLAPEALDRMKASLAFSYPFLEATQAPSKQTATGLKGRQKDEEAAQDTTPPKQPQRSWRSPSFHSTPSGREYGSVVHAAMQYIRYERCSSEEGIRQEIRRMEQEGFLNVEQAAAIPVGQLAAFFATELGRKLVAGNPCLREFKFSILDDASRYGQGLEGEQVLLQGVVDCALLEEEGITIIDFKSDKVMEETLVQAAERYRLQVQVYADALSRIYEMPVHKSVLYFFRLNRFVTVE